MEKQTRDFIHVRDVAEALRLAVEKKNLRCETFNVSTGVPTSINKLVDTLRTVSGSNLRVKHGPARLGDIRFSYGDGSRAAEKLGFKARVDMLKGLKLLFEAACTS